MRRGSGTRRSRRDDGELSAQALIRRLGSLVKGDEGLGVGRGFQSDQAVVAGSAPNTGSRERFENPAALGIPEPQWRLGKPARQNVRGERRRNGETRR